MRLEQAEAALSPLIVISNGWDDEAVEFYGEQLARLDYPELLSAACIDVATTWKSTRRPPLGVIMDAYKTQIRHADLPREVEEVTGSPVYSSGEGRRYAAQGYLDECALHGREPNWPFFERLFGAVAT